MPYSDPKKIHAKNKQLQTRRRTDIEQWARRLVSNIPARARKLNIPFDLTVENLLSLVPKDHCCPVLGIKMTFGGERSRCSMSLDRIDAAGGYTNGNCQVISLRANALKSNASLDELQKVVNYMRPPRDPSLYLGFAT